MNIFTKATIYYTRAVAEEIKHNKAFSTQVLFAIRRFYCQDWGDTSAEDKAVNEDALKYKDFILAAYATCKGRLWITAESTDKTEYDIITVLFPADY